MHRQPAQWAVFAAAPLIAALGQPLKAALPDADRDSLLDAKSPRWRPGEIIVKFREASDPRISEELTADKSPTQLLSQSLQELLAAHPVTSIRPLAHPALRRLEEPSGLRGTYLFQFSEDGLDVGSLCRELSKDQTIEYAEPNFLLRADFIPNDPYFSSFGSWGQPYDDQWGLKVAHVTAAWDLA